ncbi:MAG: trypsin-like peptidase domain-containing protein [Pseudomonadota bacterium]
MRTLAIRLFLFSALALALMSPASAVERVASEARYVEEPLSFRQALDFRSESPLSLTRLDQQKLVAEDAQRAQAGQPVRVAVKRNVPVLDRSQGRWTQVDETSIWRLEVNAGDAQWLSFAFENVFLPPGAALFVYSDDHRQLLGPYTEADNKSHKKLWTAMIEGQSAVIEINVPTRMKPFLTFDLKSVNHGYRDLKSLSTPKAGACNIDVVCPQGDDWRDQIRSVARYIFDSQGGTFTCTGNMVNNATGDRKPYFLTASHCVSTAAEVQSMVLFWNFEKSMCGGPNDGSQAQSQSGATLLATIGSLDGPEPRFDMTLVELDTTPPDSFNVRWTGWDTTDTTPSSGVSIHHPDGTEKRISVDSGPIINTNFGSTAPNPNSVHIMIAAWDEGTTEGGSSGSGFWNQDQRLVGVLSGGGASCDTPDAPDFYAHLASHYDVGTTSATRLKAWLDPDDTGITLVDGVDACDPPTVSFSINPNPAQANELVTFTSTVSGTGPFTYAWDFDGDDVVDSTLPSPTHTYTSAYVGNVTLEVTATQTCTASSSRSIIAFPPGGNSPPEAVATITSATADERTTVQLDASGSSDPNGDALTYSWRQSAGPNATIANSSAAVTNVTLPDITGDTSATFEVTVTDVFGASDIATVTVSIVNVNRAPTATVSQVVLSANEGASVMLNAVASSDPDGDAVTFAWSQTAGLAVTLNNPTSATASFTAPEVSAATSLTFSVTVTDPGGLSDSASMSVTVNDTTPPPSSGGGGGGGGAAGMFGLLLVLFAAVRRHRRWSPLVAGVALVSLGACSTPDTNYDEVPTGVSVQSADAGDVLTLTLRDGRKQTARITDAQTVRAIATAFNERERRYEKIKPLFEYELEMDMDGQTQTWLVSPKGYVQQAGSYELYRVDMATLAPHMR